MLFGVFDGYVLFEPGEKAITIFSERSQQIRLIAVFREVNSWPNAAGKRNFARPGRCSRVFVIALLRLFQQRAATRDLVLDSVRFVEILLV